MRGFFDWLQEAFGTKRPTHKVDTECEKQEHEAWWRWLEDAKREEWDREDAAEKRARQAAEEGAAREDWRRHHEPITMDDIDQMDGTAFEQFLERLFERMGYAEIQPTPRTNDDGVDIVCRAPNGARVAVQAKRWTGKVGKSAVQEVYTGRTCDGCDEAIVVTNSQFTAEAHATALKCRVTLHDRRWLREQIKKYLPTGVPNFSWEEYSRMVKLAARSTRPPLPGGPGGCLSFSEYPKPPPP
jgi:restriction endonuclease Mrr